MRNSRVQDFLVVAGCLALAVSCSETRGASLSIDIHGASKHFSSEKYNEHNPGLGFTLDQGKWSYSLGYYKNSVYRDSAYVSAGWSTEVLPYARLGFIAGVVTGYKPYPVPLVLPRLSLSTERARINIMAAPAIPHVTPAVIMFSTQFTLGEL
jgi:hypothetical protein